MTVCLVTGVEESIPAKLPVEFIISGRMLELDAERLWGGGVGKAFGAIG